MLVKRKGEADSVWDSLFSGISPEGNTLLTARCSQIGEIVCFPWGAENFTTICVSNWVCRSSAKDYSGVRHFRESNDRTGFEPEPSAPLSEKTRFFSKKMQKSLSICKKKLNIPYGNAPATVGGRQIFRKNL